MAQFCRYTSTMVSWYGNGMDGMDVFSGSKWLDEFWKAHVQHAFVVFPGEFQALGLRFEVDLRVIWSQAAKPEDLPMISMFQIANR